jgi:hypothetical protein
MYLALDWLYTEYVRNDHGWKVIDIAIGICAFKND